MSFWATAMVAAKSAVKPPTYATTSSARGEAAKIAKLRATR